MSNKKVILVSQFVNNFGSGFSRIALIILVTTWFKNPIYVGIYSFFLFVPIYYWQLQLVTLLIRAEIKKIVDKYKFSFSNCSVRNCIVNVLQSKIVFLLVFFAIVYNLFSGFYMPVVTKITVQIFDRNEYNDINAAISTAMTGANLFSGIIVTFFISFLSTYFLFIFDFMSYLVITILLIQLRIKPIAETAKTEKGNFLSFLNGFEVVREFLNTYKVVVPVFLAAVLFNIILAPNDVYLTQISSRVFNNPRLVGFMESFFSLGFLLGSLFYKIIITRVPMHNLIETALVLV